MGGGGTAREPGAWWGRVKKTTWSWELFLGCCDAGDVIDGHQCIISIMRGSGGNLKRLLSGVGVHVDDRKEETAGREKWLEHLQRREMCFLAAAEIVFDRVS